MNPVASKRLSAPGVAGDLLLLEALKLNWEHARHVEKQRNTLVIAYAGAMLAAGAVALSRDAQIPREAACLAGFLITVLCWGMTYKWNLAFDNQIRKADLCARSLSLLETSLAGSQLHILHSYIGFPIRDKRLPTLNVKLMFNFLYGLATIAWLLVLFVQQGAV